MRLLARLLTPRSYCAGCGRPWYSDVRRPCRCGEQGRIFARTLTDNVAIKEAIGGRKQ